jgi:alanyl-tRNA synthetase
MTERLYYNDSFLREFDANVLDCQPAGERWQLVLDRTAFYPTSGGQPHDIGTFGEARVGEVLERDSDHAVVHFTDRPLPTGAVHGVIDWERRFDHMQQHTGQHLLSAAFVELFGMQTASFHLGRDVSTIDVAASSVSQEQLAAAERRVNQIIFEDRVIQIFYGTAAELAASGIRKQVQREGLLRVIAVEGFDRQPCGGTHAARTGQVGVILLRRCEKFRGNWRVEFLCGWRASKAAHTQAVALEEAARLLSCAPGEVPSMTARVLEERQATHRARQRLTEQLAEAQASNWLCQPPAAANSASDGSSGAPGRAASTAAGGVRTMCKLLEDQDSVYARLLANRLVSAPGVRALLGTRDGHVIFAQSQGLGGDMNTLLRECLAAAGGKGGGSKDFAQGRVAAEGSAVERVLEDARSRLEK